MYQKGANGSPFLVILRQSHFFKLLTFSFHTLYGDGVWYEDNQYTICHFLWPKRQGHQQLFQIF